MRKLLLAVALLTLSSVMASVTVAAAPNPRTITFNDPKDVAAPLSGSADPDLQSATVAYDSAGTITVTATFYAPFMGGVLDYGIGFDLGSQIIGGGCMTLDRSAGGLVTIKSGGAGSGIFTIENVSGSLSPTVTHSADYTSYTAVFTSSAIANEDWTCAGVDNLSVFYYAYSWCEDPGCPIDSTIIDGVNQAAWFSGYSPVDLARPYWTLSAKRDGLGGFDLYVGNPKIPALTDVDYKACIAIKGGKRRCQTSTLLGPDRDDLSFTLDKRVLRPLRVSIYVAGVLQVAKRVTLR